MNKEYLGINLGKNTFNNNLNINLVKILLIWVRIFTSKYKLKECVRNDLNT
jgi:hypothetical protein